MPTDGFAYDVLSYPSGAFAQTHPDRLAAFARLHGLTPAPVDRCRVLELGAGDGTNLLPLAAQWPESLFVGIDLAADAIVDGQKAVEALGLSNMRLDRRDVLDITPEFGEFDFIICHGLYSWVSDEVRDKILQICRHNLAPHGIAYVSYNALPGCHVRRMVWEMLRFHVRAQQSPMRKAEEALSLARFLAAGQTDDTAYASAIREEAERLTSKHPAVVFHDDLSEGNTPFYFHEFARQAAEHGLQYLCEAEFADLWPPRFPDPIEAILKGMEGEVIMRETYIDFLKGRRFRQTLLCRSELPLRRPVAAERLREFHLVFLGDREDGGTGEFRGRDGGVVRTDDAFVKAALEVLCERFPAPTAFAEMVAEAMKSAERQVDEMNLLATLREACGAGLLELWHAPPRLTSSVSAQPATTALIRWQAATTGWVTSPRHIRCRLEDAVSRRLLTLLDGTRDHHALLADLRAFVAHVLADDPARRDDIIAEFEAKLPHYLHCLAKLGLLVE